MKQVGNVYGEALYSLACEEGLSHVCLQELEALEYSFSQEPKFLRLLDATNISKEERSSILDESFRGKVQPYVLNFLKLLSEKSYARYFGDCCTAFRNRYNEDNGILPVTAVTAVPLEKEKQAALAEKLSVITGKTVQLHNRINPEVLGGIRLDYSGVRLDDTIAHRLEDIRARLTETVL